jgi:hypothetical protein
MVIHGQHGGGNRQNFCKVLKEKNMFSALYGMYTAACTAVDMPPTQGGHHSELLRPAPSIWHAHKFCQYRGHLPHNTPAEDISDGLVSLGFDFVTVKPMTDTRHSAPEESKIINLPLFMVTLQRGAESQEVFRLCSLCHTAIRVEAHRAQYALTKCHNCQQFGHGGENYKQPPRCLWCGGGHV